MRLSLHALPLRAAAPACSCHGDCAGPAWTFLPARGLPWASWICGFFLPDLGRFWQFLQFAFPSLSLWASNACMSGPGPVPGPLTPGSSGDSSFLLCSLGFCFCLHIPWLPPALFHRLLTPGPCPVTIGPAAGSASFLVCPVACKRCIGVGHQPSSGLRSRWGARCACCHSGRHPAWFWVPVWSLETT